MKKLFICLLVLGLLLCGCVKAPVPETEGLTETAAPTEAPKEFSLGVIENNVYTNAYVNWGCDFGQGWSFAGAEALQQLPEDVRSLIDGSEMSAVLEDYPQIFDLAAENREAYLAVNVVCTAISEAEQALYAGLTEEQTLDAVLENRDRILESYAQAGMEVESMEKVQATFLGEPHFAIRTAARSGIVPVYMLQVMDYSRGSYGVTLTATSYLEDNTQDILDLFYPAEGKPHIGTCAPSGFYV